MRKYQLYYQSYVHHSSSTSSTSSIKSTLNREYSLLLDPDTNSNDDTQRCPSPSNMSSTSSTHPSSTHPSSTSCPALINHHGGILDACLHLITTIHCHSLYFQKGGWRISFEKTLTILYNDGGQVWGARRKRLQSTSQSNSLVIISENDNENDTSNLSKSLFLRVGTLNDEEGDEIGGGYVSVDALQSETSSIIQHPSSVSINDDGETRDNAGPTCISPFMTSMEGEGMRDEERDRLVSITHDLSLDLVPSGLEEDGVVSLPPTTIHGSSTPITTSTPTTTTPIPPSLASLTPSVTKHKEDDEGMDIVDLTQFSNDERCKITRWMFEYLLRYVHVSGMVDGG